MTRRDYFQMMAAGAAAAGLGVHLKFNDAPRPHGRDGRDQLGREAALVAAAFASNSIAAESKGAKSSPDRAAFEKLKSLAGEWTGQTGQEGKVQEVSAVYKTTSNGSVVMETLFPGSPHEMVTVYYLDGEHLVLVHYCAAGNQPRMKLKVTPTRPMVREICEP